MTDYYVLGRGRDIRGFCKILYKCASRSARIRGPYTLEDARAEGAQMAAEDGEDIQGVKILGIIETVRPSTEVHNDGEMYAVYERYLEGNECD